MSAAAIVVAAGEGTRMRARQNKVFLQVGGRSILEYSLALLESSPHIDDVVLVTRASDLDACESLKGRFPKLRAVVGGGDVRHRSEFAGLQVIAARIDAKQIETVLVHDAVRPFASPRLIERLLAHIDRTIGCVPGQPLTGSVAHVADGWIAGYPKNLWAVQTPQVFQATWLLEAHNKAARQGFIGTDTASVVEWAGGDVAVIQGEPDNIKITTPDHLALAERIAASLGR
jgi:2-C-methyl-D-erythritol 4-phosphate cytidylyltransferase